MKSSDFGKRKMGTRTELMAFMTMLLHFRHPGIMRRLLAGQCFWLRCLAALTHCQVNFFYTILSDII